MSEATELIERAHSIRKRLMYPPNPVADRGINLKKEFNGVKGWKPSSTLEPLPIITRIPRARVRVLEYQKDIESTLPLFGADDILRFVERYTFTSVEVMRQSTRRPKEVFSRTLAVYLLQKYTRSQSAASLARALYKNHTSILYLRDKINDAFAAKTKLAETLKGFEDALLAITGNDSSRLALASISESTMAVRQREGVPEPEIQVLDQECGRPLPDSESEASEQEN